MLINFEMITPDNNIEYKVFGTLDDNVLTFKDKSMTNTFIKIIFNKKKVTVMRTGNVTMEQSFVLNEKINGFFKNSEGIELEIYSLTKELIVEENLIYIAYDCFISNDYQSTNKLIIKY